MLLVKMPGSGFKNPLEELFNLFQGLCFVLLPRRGYPEGMFSSSPPGGVIQRVCFHPPPWRGRTEVGGDFKIFP